MQTPGQEGSCFPPSSPHNIQIGTQCILVVDQVTEETSCFAQIEVNLDDKAMFHFFNEKISPKVFCFLPT